MLLPDVFHFDDKFEEHRLEYEAIRREILGEDGDDSGSEDEDDDGEDDEDDAEAAASESGAFFLSALLTKIVSVLAPNTFSPDLIVAIALSSVANA